MTVTHRETGFIAAENGVSRAGEGAFARLKDGRIMLAYTEYYTADSDDAGPANIAAVYSRDNGETWGEHRILLEKGADDCNIMSVSFLSAGEELIIFYLKKFLKNGKTLCIPFLRRSGDDGESWSEEQRIGKRDLYYVVNNDRVIRLKNGRIIVPAAIIDPFAVRPENGAALCFITSDDNGYTWTEQKQELTLPFDNRMGLEEPGLYEHNDGSLWCYIRTHLGCQYSSISYDSGESWSAPEPMPFFSSPASPMLVKKVCNATVAIFNPIPGYTSRPEELWGRTPYLLAISETDAYPHNGEGFTVRYMLETDRSNNYCYPAILDNGTDFLIAYYHSNGTGCPLNSLKIVKVCIME